MAESRWREAPQLRRGSAATLWSPHTWRFKAFVWLQDAEDRPRGRSRGAGRAKDRIKRCSKERGEDAGLWMMTERLASGLLVTQGYISCEIKAGG